ncbi:hypothetical protein COCVIDRAFT_95123 [Bipolaris victoriae FI3]|uniref:C2H2-type domain-containing protein n=1 Tax=Bipolaris victoriae (strain FI3) TaxID=930091 RepID=W7ER80_BIPV3|nr:hypothetical protein COCVIDRAFT_95123 [Bipolaris victoriae FI3]
MSVGIPTAVTGVNEAPPNPVLQPVTVLAPRGGVSPIVNDNRIPCLVELCTVTFGRTAERNRHMKKHRSYEFRCKHSGCNKTFYRPDKLRDHYRQGHKDADPLLN